MRVEKILRVLLLFFSLYAALYLGWDFFLNMSAHSWGWMLVDLVAIYFWVNQYLKQRDWLLG